MASSNFPNRPFRLEERVWVAAQNGWNSGNNTLVHSELWIIKNSASGVWANGGSSAQMNICGVAVGANGNFSYDFRNSDSLLVLAQDNWFQNDGNGNLYVQIDGYATVAQLGSTEVHSGFWANRITRPPGQTYLQYIYNITTTTADIIAIPPDDGGAAIDLYSLQAAEDSAFTVGLKSYVGGSSGTITGLKSGTPYWFRASAHNANGWVDGPSYGPYSTLAAIYVSNGSSWLPAQVLVSNGTAWKNAEALYSKAGVWTTPTSL